MQKRVVVTGASSGIGAATVRRFVAVSYTHLDVYKRQLPCRRVVLILDESNLDAELRERNIEEVVGAAVDGRRGNDVVARLSNVQHGVRRCCLAAREQ